MHHWGGGGRGKVVGLRTNLICMYIHAAQNMNFSQGVVWKGCLGGGWRVGVSRDLFGHFIFNFLWEGVDFALLLKVHMYVC